MKLLKTIEFILSIAGIGLLFFNWETGLIVLWVTMLLYVFPAGPYALLNTLSGSLIIGGIICFFVNWTMAVLLILFGLGVARFNIWSHRVNDEYYSNEKFRGEK